MLRNYYRVAAALLLICMLATAGQAQEKKAELRVLFVGNSFTYVNDLPGTLQKLAESAGEKHKLVVAQAVHGGYRFRDHWEKRTFDKAIKEGKWDVVVLQGQSQEPSFPAEQRRRDMNPFVEKLAGVFKETGARCVLFETWAAHDGDTINVRNDTYPAMQERLRQGYVDAARLIDAPVVPVGDAWAAALKQKPALKLWNNDGRHPSPVGTYLAACVFYKSLYKKSPVGIRFTASLDAPTTDLLQHVADSTGKPLE